MGWDLYFKRVTLMTAELGKVRSREMVCLISQVRDLPDCPVVGTWCSRCCDPGFNPWSGG